MSMQICFGQLPHSNIILWNLHCLVRVNSVFFGVRGFDLFLVRESLRLLWLHRRSRRFWLFFRVFGYDYRFLDIYEIGRVLRMLRLCTTRQEIIADFLDFRQLLIQKKKDGRLINHLGSQFISFESNEAAFLDHGFVLCLRLFQQGFVLFVIGLELLDFL